MPDKFLNSNEFSQVNRFASTLSGAFRAFLIYKHDNKAIDEILGNLAKRFQNACEVECPLKLGISSSSLTFRGTPVGFAEVTIYLATALRHLGFKEILFAAPLESRHFFPVLNILSGKESREIKLNKLTPFLNDGDSKPICLTPITANAIMLRLDDNIIRKKLESLSAPISEGMPSFVTLLEQIPITCLLDLYFWIRKLADQLDSKLKTFVKDICQATQEGYFPAERFFSVFPLPGNHRIYSKRFALPATNMKRKITPLGHQFLPEKRERQRPGFDTLTYLSSFTNEEILKRDELRVTGALQSPLQDLELAANLMQETGPSFSMGLRMLLKILATNNPVAVQEKTLKYGIQVWMQFQGAVQDAGLMSLFSGLRQSLSAPHNVSLILFPIRNAIPGSDLYVRISRFLFSLGEAVLPSLIQALDTEADRGMRKKLCLLITDIGKSRGVDFLIESLSQASHFLMRNLIMILGDIKSTQAIEAIATCLKHAQKMVRSEATRSLIKIGTSDSICVLQRALIQPLEVDLKQSIVEYFLQLKERNAVENLIHLAKDTSVPKTLKHTVYKAIGTIGGLQAKQFLQSLQQNPSLLSRFNSDERETQSLIQSLLARMT